MTLCWAAVFLDVADNKKKGTYDSMMLLEL